MAIVDALPSTQTGLVNPSIVNKMRYPTIHDDLQIVEQSMDDLQCVGASHPGLLQGESV